MPAYIKSDSIKNKEMSQTTLTILYHTILSIENITWPLTGNWNIDILSAAFTRYLETLNEFVENIDNYKTIIKHFTLL